MRRIAWTVAMDAALTALREQGHPWRAIAATLGIKPETAMRQGRALGLPAGHRLNSGPMTGVRIVHGARPQIKRFIRPSYISRLGHKWCGFDRAPAVQVAAHDRGARR
jgi:hypothetical protein